MNIDAVPAEVSAKYAVGLLRTRSAYGPSWNATSNKTGRKVVLEKLYDAFQNATDASRTCRHVLFVKQLTALHSDSCRILRLLDLIPSNEGKDVFLVWEHSEIDLHAVIRANILEPIHIAYTAWQLFRALSYVHSASLVHFEIKPTNMMMNSECFLKLSEFGLAKTFAEASETTHDDYGGGRWYHPPELLVGSQRLGPAVDMWAAGCVLAEMLLGKPLLPGYSSMNQLERTVELTGAPSKADIAGVASKFTKHMLEAIKIPERKSLESLLPKAPAPAVDLLRQLLQFNPHNRIDAQTAMQHPYFDQFQHSEPDLVFPGSIEAPSAFVPGKFVGRGAEACKILLKQVKECKQRILERIRQQEAAEAAAVVAALDAVPLPPALQRLVIAYAGSCFSSATLAGSSLPVGTERNAPTRPATAAAAVESKYDRGDLKAAAAVKSPAGSAGRPELAVKRVSSRSLPSSASAASVGSGETTHSKRLASRSSSSHARSSGRVWAEAAASAASAGRAAQPASGRLPPARGASPRGAGAGAASGSQSAGAAISPGSAGSASTPAGSAGSASRSAPVGTASSSNRSSRGRGLR